MNKKGFTLIELLVVIAIIGMLSSLAVVSLNTARNKARDAQIKSDLSQIRTFAAVQYDSGVFTGFDMTNTEISNLLPPSCSPDSATYQINVGGINDSAWVAWAGLCSDETVDFCVDSTGQAKEVASLAGTETVCP
ncbi:type II secretion system protein [Candidatus Falkowbacteria bacterium]|uniref:Type II secretion system protein GspG C-terminal domain-containing protein n=1 Tax=Candidatus Buchananbacteria bacterium CG10_big_fil_rev_8_21_14_0_10_33_19 TaxID=1974525 RepID=A0A2H0W4G3_9BACT|nr:type II secretion system protein [Candidatus Falkowbacteria bacterium]PIS06243.1 MAG: hypothetical protein COT80_01580 [Candidatus Buchananbacteria bacterium CG10_big_fil_rev_8_21_14_0_10_33_19]